MKHILVARHEKNINITFSRQYSEQGTQVNFARMRFSP